MADSFKKLFLQWEQNHKIKDKDSALHKPNYKQPTKKDKNNIPTLDLHGYTKEQSLLKLNSFVLQAKNSGSKKIRIIHGAGIHSKDGVPILKRSVRLWLENHPTLIKNFRPASIGEGRGGATIAYIYSK